jgi:hypothetical protein
MALDPKIPNNSQAMPATPGASPAPAPAAGAAQQQGLTVRPVDRPECAEIFADSVTSLYFDGQTLRLELGITRFDEVKQGAPLTARRYPACRLVLSPAGALELINRTQQIGQALAQANAARAKPAESKPSDSGPLL